MTYLLRDIDPALWRRVKVRAAGQGKTIKELLIGWLIRYADGKL